ncbi:MAG: hypothetical protein ACK4PI_00320 [Tepidisphaerales bacterium]
MAEFVFRPRTPTRWKGRYARIPGQHYVFCARTDDTIDVVDKQDDVEATCTAVWTQAVVELARAINEVKRRYTRKPGGSFQINEFGQVLVPLAGEFTERLYVGDCEGTITFRAPDGRRFTLADDQPLQCGDPWPWPYVGMPFSLSKNNNVYFTQKSGSDETVLYPPVQDYELIHRLRRLRPSEGCRFIVNPHGVVLTKVEIAQGVWRPTYAGRINPARWFVKEQ